MRCDWRRMRWDGCEMKTVVPAGALAAVILLLGIRGHASPAAQSVVGVMKAGAGAAGGY